MSVSSVLVSDRVVVIDGELRMRCWISEARVRTLNFRLYIIYRICGFDIESDGLAREGLDEDLHGDLNKPGGMSLQSFEQISKSFGG